MNRTLAFGLAGLVSMGWTLYHTSEPDVSARIAINAVNGGNGEAMLLRTFVQGTDWAGAGLLIAMLLMILISSWNVILRKGHAGLALLVAFSGVGMSGCLRPFDKPEFTDIGNNETAFVLPLEGDTKEQTQFQSQDYLDQRKIAAKRVQITHRWIPEGRLWQTGKYVPMVRVVKVDRSPITRQWLAAEQKGQQGDQAIWVESADSVGFSMGFSCTACITEEDASTFLYWYPSGSLDKVMDSEIRARVQQNAAEIAAQYPLDELRGKKQEIIDSVKLGVVDFFTKRGITITTVGMFGGMTYENPQIQQAIDKVFVAQQEKNVALAEFDAQQKKNDKVELEAQAEKIRQTIESEAKADAIKKVAAAVAEANQNPQFFALRQLETQEKLIEKWDGKYPLYFMGSGESPAMLLQMPKQAMAEKAAK